MSIDIMIDLETMGVSAGCAILSIGAVTLDEKHKFYAKICLDSCSPAGLKIDLDTIAWWQKQSKEARGEAFSGTKDLVLVLGEFADWFRMVEKLEGTAFLWGNGADFDLPILGAAYEAVGMKKPWKPFNGRCYRTIKNWARFKDITPDPFEGVKHNALADAIFQARHLIKILRFDRSTAIK